MLTNSNKRSFWSDKNVLNLGFDHGFDQLYRVHNISLSMHTNIFVFKIVMLKMIDIVFQGNFGNFGNMFGCQNWVGRCFWHLLDREEENC